MGHGKMMLLFKVKQIFSKTKYKIKIHMKKMQQKTKMPLVIVLQNSRETLKSNGK